MNRNRLGELLTALRESPVGRALAAVQRFAVEIVLKRVLAPLALVLAYFLAVGPMSLLVRLLRPGLLSPAPLAPGSYWIRAEGYEPDEAQAVRQS